MTNDTVAPNGQLKTWLASLAVVAAFVPSIITSMFLGGQAWYSFAEPEPGVGDWVWGTLCVILLVAPFVASPAAVFLTRRHGMSWPLALLIGAAAGFVAICVGMFLGMLTAALGGM